MSDTGTGSEFLSVDRGDSGTVMGSLESCEKTTGLNLYVEARSMTTTTGATASLQDITTGPCSATPTATNCRVAPMNRFHDVAVT
jgi:hypothetical protein